jgi:hypothetical protein
MNKRILLLLPAIVTLAGPAAANPLPWTQIGLYGDPAGTVNVVYDTGPGPIEIFVVQTVYIEPAVSEARFMAPAPACFTATYLGDTNIYPTVGNSQAGAWISYGPCLTGSVLVMTIQYYGQGTSSQCCWYDLQPYPGSSYVESQMCGGSDWLWTHGEGIYVSTDPAENCGTPVEQSTWGRVKAMYR